MITKEFIELDEINQELKQYCQESIVDSDYWSAGIEFYSASSEPSNRTSSEEFYIGYKLGVTAGTLDGYNLVLKFYYPGYIKLSTYFYRGTANWLEIKILSYEYVKNILAEMKEQVPTLKDYERCIAQSGSDSDGTKFYGLYDDKGNFLNCYIEALYCSATWCPA